MLCNIIDKVNIIYSCYVYIQLALGNMFYLAYYFLVVQCKYTHFSCCCDIPLKPYRMHSLFILYLVYKFLLTNNNSFYLVSQLHQYVLSTLLLIGIITYINALLYPSVYHARLSFQRSGEFFCLYIVPISFMSRNKIQCCVELFSHGALVCINSNSLIHVRTDLTFSERAFKRVLATSQV